MPKRESRRRPPLSAAAGRDLIAILKRSLSDFGPDAAVRYNELIMQAVRDVAAEPNRLGSTVLDGTLVVGLRAYRIELSRKRVAGPREKDPRHVLLCRQDADVVQVLRILHDSRILSRALPAKYRTR